jgi:hypothetical protein
MTIIIAFGFTCLVRNFYLGITVRSFALPEDVKGLDKDDIEECKKCGMQRSKRTHHCSICGKCVVKLDHHCIILNNCIGEKNYRYFLSYLFLVAWNSYVFLIVNLYSLYSMNLDFRKVIFYITSRLKACFSLL